MIQAQTSTKEVHTQPSFKEVHDIAMTDAETQQSLKEVLDMATAEKKRLTLVYENRLFLTVVPIDDVNVIEKLEDCIDNANADDALKEEGFISEEQLDKKLGW
ncbi:MAG: hypothetical protein DRR19_11090 [Candidatus Parabeggiatoa sp. nov. 1]|nr:MAG: hypothetical protein DRR19_11090 [Gammaproteobacteria bacterium]